MLVLSFERSKGGSESFFWKVIVNKDCKDVLIGYNSVMFMGDGGYVVLEKVLYKVLVGEFL